MNKQILQHTDMDVYTSLINAINSNLRCHTFAKITAIYNEEQTGEIKRWQYTIDAQPIVDEFILAKENGKEVDKSISLPEIYNIPYISNSPPQVGDYCILLHLDRSISSIKTPKEDGHIDSIGRMHELTDCIAICGVFKPVPQYYQHNIRIYKEKTSDSYTGPVFDIFITVINSDNTAFDKTRVFEYIGSFPNYTTLPATGRIKLDGESAIYAPIAYIRKIVSDSDFAVYNVVSDGSNVHLITTLTTNLKIEDVVCKI